MRVPLRPAKLGRTDQLWSNSAVRGDEMTWLSPPKGQGLADRAEHRVRTGIHSQTPSAQPKPREPCHTGNSEFDALSSQLRAAYAPTTAPDDGTGGDKGDQDL